MLSTRYGSSRAAVIPSSNHPLLPLIVARLAYTIRRGGFASSLRFWPFVPRRSPRSLLHTSRPAHFAQRTAKGYALSKRSNAVVTQGQSAKKSHRYRIVNLLTQQERVAEIETPSLAVLKSAIALVLQSQSTPYMLLTREGDVATDASLSHSELLYVLHYTGENGMVVSSPCGSHSAESHLASHTPLPSSSDLTQVVHAALSTSYCVPLLLPSSLDCNAKSCSLESLLANGSLLKTKEVVFSTTETAITAKFDLSVFDMYPHISKLVFPSSPCVFCSP